MATPPDRNPPKARNVPERADTGAVDPTDYVPTEKEAPTPASAAPGAVSSDAPVDPALPEIADSQRKPHRRNAPVAETVRAVKGVVDTAKKAVDTVRNAVSPSNQPKLSDKATIEGARVKDAKRMRGVKRYRKEVRNVINPLIRAAFINTGYAGVSSADVEAVFASLGETKALVGCKVSKTGNLSIRSLPVTDVLSYVLGDVAIDTELMLARQWLAHPTLFDLGVIVGTAASLYQSLTAKDSAISLAIEAAVAKHVAKNSEEPIKAEARVSDAPFEG